MTTDTLTRAMTTAAVLLVAAIAAVVSFLHVESLAVTHGQDRLAAVLLPLSIDGAVAAMSLVMLRCARSCLPVPLLARGMLVLAVGATLAANVTYGAAFGVTGALISGWPAVAFVGCVEVSVLMVRKTRPAGVSEPSEPQPVTTIGPGRRPAIQADKTADPQPGLTTRAVPVMTVAQQAAAAGVSERTMYRRLSAASGNGKAH